MHTDNLSLLITLFAAVEKTPSRLLNKKLYSHSVKVQKFECIKSANINTSN